MHYISVEMIKLEKRYKSFDESAIMFSEMK